jgi:hypothetical protein
MKIVIASLIFHLVSILLFSVIYFFLESHFIRDEIYKINNKNKPEIIDCLFLAVTIECGVGYSDLYPVTNLSKSMLIIQQLSMISMNILLLYILTSKKLRIFYK